MKQKFIFRNIIICISALLLIFGTSCNSEYDDSGIRKEIEELAERIKKLEEQVDKLNGDIDAINKIIQALESNTYIAKVEQTSDGYVIYFTDNTRIEIKNGENGENGKDGKGAPVIGTDKDSDGVYYWTITTDGTTDWLLDGEGNKMRVTAENVIPVLSVDSEGYWTISYDNGATTTRIKDSEGNPVSALDTGTGDSLFSSITFDDDNVYFRLANGTTITVPRRSNFYMLIRNAPEQAPFVYGEQKVYDIESVGVEKVVVTKPNGWLASYDSNTLTITAPEEANMAYCETEGEVALIYFGANNQSSVVSMKVIASKDYTGVTVGSDFTVNITEITDKTVAATVTPADNSMKYHVGVYLADKYDQNGEAAFVNEMLQMYNFYLQYGMLDYYIRSGVYSYAGSQLTPDTNLYITVFGISVDTGSQTCSAATAVMTVPLRTKTEVVINSQYRIEVSDVSWFGAKYITAPTDDLPYMHGFVKKGEIDGAASEQEFMEDYVRKIREKYWRNLDDGTLTWSDLTSVGAQTVVAPGPNLLQGKALTQDTDYYAFAFGCKDGTVTSTLSKKPFKTGVFSPIEQCTFEIITTVDRQNVDVTIIPSKKNITYIWGIYQRSFYDTYDDDCSFAADDLYFIQQDAADNQRTLDEYLTKGDANKLVKDLWAATGYIVYVYGCDENGVITTQPKIVSFVTKGTSDQG